MNRSIAAAVAALVTLVVASPALAQDDGPDDAGESDGRVELALIDQTFDLAPDGDIELVYRITGDLADVAEIAPPTTSTTTTTTEPPGTDPDAEPEPTTTPAPATTSTPTSSTTTSSTTTSSTTTSTTTAVADDGEPPPPPPPVTVRVLNYPVLDVDDDLDAIVGPDPRRSVLPAAVDGVDLDDVRPRIVVDSPTSATLSIRVPTDSGVSIAERLAFDDDGVHPVVVELRVDGDVVATHGTVVERRSGSSATPPTIDLALFASAPDPGPSAPAADRRAAVEAFAGLIDLAARTGPPITFDVAPRVVTDLAEGGRLDDDVAAVLADDAVLSAPATPFDISSAAAVDRVDAFQRQLVAGENDVLDALGVPPDRTIWHQTTPLSGEGAQVLRNLGVRYLAMTAGLYESTIDDGDDPPGRDRFVPVELPDGSTMPILIIDDELGAQFTTRATEATLDAGTPVEWSVATVARLRIAQLDAPPSERFDARSRLVAAPGLGAFDPRLVTELERFADTTEAIRFTAGGSLPATTDTAQVARRPTLPETAGPSLEARLARIADVEVFLASAASMLPADDDRPAIWERRLDSFVSTSFAEDEVDDELDALLAEADVLFSAVVAPEPDTFTLTGDGSIPIRIGNTIDEPLNVVLSLGSPRLSFPDGDVALVLAPNDVTEVDVALQIRSNGTSPLTVEVTTPLGDPLIEPVTLTSRVNALTGLGQVLTGALVLMLLAWWFSHWRSRRKADADAVDSDTVDDRPGSPDVTIG